MPMRPEDRPCVVFEVVWNKGKRARPPITNERGKVVRPGQDAESVHIERKALVDTTLSNSPFTWLRAEWFTRRLQSGWVPIGVENMDKLPANYPAEWRKMIEDALVNIYPAIVANLKTREMQATVEQLQAKFAAQNVQPNLNQKDEGNDDTTQTARAESGESPEPSEPRGKKALGATRQAANA